MKECKRWPRMLFAQALTGLDMETEHFACLSNSIGVRCVLVSRTSWRRHSRLVNGQS